MKHFPTQILGIDPGVKNFACSLVTGTDSPDFLDLHMTFQKHYGEDDLPLQDSTVDEVFVFASTFKELLVSLNVNQDSFVIIERYEYRGHTTGKTIEQVNLMIGIMAYVCPCPCRLIRPTDWKTFRNRRPEVICGMGPTDHEEDALNMALYQWHQIHHRSKKS